MNESHVHIVLENKTEVFEFLRKRYPMIHASNVFYRDLLYGLQAYLASKGVTVRGRNLEGYVQNFIDAMVHEGTFHPFDHQTWTLNYPEFRTPAIPKTTPAKAGTQVVAGS